MKAKEGFLMKIINADGLRGPSRYETEIGFWRDPCSYGCGQNEHDGSEMCLASKTAQRDNETINFTPTLSMKKMLSSTHLSKLHAV